MGAWEKAVAVAVAVAAAAVRRSENYWELLRKVSFLQYDDNKNI
jgi:hypothetical protein